MSPRLIIKDDPFFNRRRQFVLKLAIALFFVMGLVPPWKESVTSTEARFEKDRGYSLIFSAPKPTYRFGTVALDFKRLGLQSVVAILAIAGAVTLTKKEIQEQPLLPFQQA